MDKLRFATVWWLEKRDNKLSNGGDESDGTIRKNHQLSKSKSMDKQQPVLNPPPGDCNHLLGKFRIGKTAIQAAHARHDTHPHIWYGYLIPKHGIFTYIYHIECLGMAF